MTVFFGYDANLKTPELNRIFFCKRFNLSAKRLTASDALLPKAQR